MIEILGKLVYKELYPTSPQLEFLNWLRQALLPKFVEGSKSSIFDD